MNRRSFFSSLFAGLAALPLVKRLCAKPELTILPSRIHEQDITGPVILGMKEWPPLTSPQYYFFTEDGIYAWPGGKISSAVVIDDPIKHENVAHWYESIMRSR